MHPLVHLVATQPQLLADHAEAYGELIAAELAQAALTWKRQLVLLAVAATGLGVAAVLSGVAVMLWPLSPAASAGGALPWRLLVTPAIPLAVALASLLGALRRRNSEPFEPIGRQVKADLAMLRAAVAA